MAILVEPLSKLWGAACHSPPLHHKRFNFVVKEILLKGSCMRSSFIHMIHSGNIGVKVLFCCRSNKTEKATMTTSKTVIVIVVEEVWVVEKRGFCKADGQFRESGLYGRRRQPVFISMNASFWQGQGQKMSKTVVLHQPLLLFLYIT